MENLIQAVKRVNSVDKPLPFSIYSSVKEQHILNVPIIKPLLIIVLSGKKELGKNSEFICHAGDFVFLPDSPSINMRNIPNEDVYFALLIEFAHEDFNGLELGKPKTQDFCTGKSTHLLNQCLIQFVESALWAHESIWSARKNELLRVLCLMGYRESLSMIGADSISYQINEMLQQNLNQDLTIDMICDSLAMSESTLRRKLKSEGTGIQEIKDKAKLGTGLHLLQTTAFSIGLVAEMCGYQSQSRFTERFKNRFGLTPSELRKTKMTDSGEILTYFD